MKNKRRLCLLFAATALSGAALVSAAVEAACPNIIFILADDLSSNSIGARGGKRYQSGPNNVVGLDAPAGLDGVSFAPRLFGDPGTPRDWILSLWCDKYVVRGPRFALREDGTLYVLENAAGNGTTIGDDNATKKSKAARFELEAVIERLGL